MKIVVDTGELRCGVPDVLGTMGATIEITQLPVGDYLLCDGVGVERKTVADLHRSIATGRLWDQLLRCRQTLDRTYLIVEGNDLDRGCISVAGVRGALLEIGDRGVTVVRSSCPQDTALWLARIAARLRRLPGAGKPRTRRFPAAASPLALLSEVPGIGPGTAGRLLERFGSVRAVAGADRTELEAVEGVGPLRAASLARILSESP